MPKADPPRFHSERQPGFPPSGASFMSVAAEVRSAEHAILRIREDSRRAQSRFYILVEKADVDPDVLEYARIEAAALYESLLDAVKIKGDFTMQMRVLRQRRDAEIARARKGRPPEENA